MKKSFWALFDAEGSRDGTVDSWRQDPIAGDAELPGMSASEAAEWALEEMGDDDENAVIVSPSGKILTWIMNSPEGEPRRWW